MIPHSFGVIQERLRAARIRGPVTPVRADLFQDGRGCEVHAAAAVGVPLHQAEIGKLISKFSQFLAEDTVAFVAGGMDQHNVCVGGGLGQVSESST